MIWHNEVITNHLGINPVKGGTPASESSSTLNRTSVYFEYIRSDGIWCEVNTLKVCSIMNIGATMIE